MRFALACPKMLFLGVPKKDFDVDIFGPKLKVDFCILNIIIIALFAFMKHQRIQNHLSRSALLQMSQIRNIFSNFSYNQNIPQKYKISSDAQKSSEQSQNVKKYAQP